MMTKSPSGALSPYYYKGGYFHGIHYGSYFSNSSALFDMIEKEQEFILKSAERKRILMDFYETELNKEVVERIVKHIYALNSRIFKLAISTDKRSLKILGRAIRRANVIDRGRVYLTTDMEDGKTWLVSDSFETA